MDLHKSWGLKSRDKRRDGRQRVDWLTKTGGSKLTQYRHGYREEKFKMSRENAIVSHVCVNLF